MKSLIAFFVLLYTFSQNTTNAETFTLPIVSVADGDTIRTRISTMPESLQNFSVRLRGIDTPEKGHRAQCEKESKLGEKATVHVITIVGKAKTMKVSNCSHDKFGGRIVCNVEVNGTDIAQSLLKANLAKPYSGGKKESWCSK